MKCLTLLYVLTLALMGCNHSTEPSLAVPITAKSKLGDVDSYAGSHKQGLRLMSVLGGPVNLNGEAATWTYVYSYPDTTLPQKLYWFHCDANHVGFDSVSQTGLGFAMITLPWFNSDSAILIAEQNGGSKFRSDNPDYSITAYVVQSLVANPTTYWQVGYYSTNNISKFIMITIDANTGALATHGAD